MLAADAHVKVVRFKTENRSTRAVDHARVNQDAGNVHALHPLRLLGVKPDRREEHEHRGGCRGPILQPDSTDHHSRSLAFHDRLVRHDPESFLDVGPGRKDLRHQNPDQLLCGVHPERGVEETAPVIGTL